MKKTTMILCALCTVLSCHAQFFSIGEPSPSVRHNTAMTSHSDITWTKQASRGHETGQREDTLSVPDSFKQQMVALWTSVSMPLDKMSVSSKYGNRFHPILKKNMPHNGIDLSVPTGSKVYAMMDGVVARTGYDRRSGNFVVIDHGEYTVSYCHLSKVLVKKGEKVKAGQATALSGNTGMSTGPHLHYGLKKGGKWCNPSILIDVVNRTRQSVLAQIQRHGGIDS